MIPGWPSRTVDTVNCRGTSTPIDPLVFSVPGSYVLCRIWDEDSATPSCVYICPMELSSFATTVFGAEDITMSPRDALIVRGTRQHEPLCGVFGLFCNWVVSI